MVFLKIILSFIKRFRNYDSFKFFFENFLDFLKKKENTVFLKNTKDFRNFQWQIYCKIVQVSLKPFRSKK